MYVLYANFGSGDWDVIEYRTIRTTDVLPDLSIECYSSDINNAVRYATLEEAQADQITGEYIGECL